MANFFSPLKRTQSEPAKGKSSQDICNSYTEGDPENNKYGKKYLEMPLEEKRKLYRCRNEYEPPENLPLWPVLWKFQSIKKIVGAGRKKVKKTYEVNHDWNNKICLHQGDITRLEIDAIVNAANTSLLGGGGVDGCIHRSAGSGLRAECAELNGCKTGNSKITSGHKLPAKYIIHTVGPFGRQPAYLKNCYDNCLRLVLKHKIRTVAFCCISTGIYGYPNEDAALVALETIREWMETDENAKKVDKIIFCVYLDIDWNIYTELLQYFFPCEEFDPEKTKSGLKEGTKRSKDSNTKEAPEINLEESSAKTTLGENLEESGSKKTPKEDPDVSSSKKIPKGNLEETSSKQIPKENKDNETKSELGDESKESDAPVDASGGTDDIEMSLDDDSELIRAVEELEQIELPEVPDHDPEVD